MVVLLIIKDLYLICVAAYRHNVKFTWVSHGFDMWVFIFQFTHVVGLFTIIVLISFVWCFMKPFLQHKEKKVWVIAILLQLSSKAASVYFDQDGRHSIIEW